MRPRHPAFRKFLIEVCSHYPTRIVILSERSESKDLSSFLLNSFLFFQFRTLLRSLHQERFVTAFPSVPSALFAKSMGGGGYCTTSSTLTYILPSSVCSKSFVSHS